MRNILLKIILMASLLANSAGLSTVAWGKKDALRPMAFSLSSSEAAKVFSKSSSTGKDGPAHHKYEALNRRESRKIVKDIIDKRNRSNLAFLKNLIRSIKASGHILELNFIDPADLAFQVQVLDDFTFNTISHSGILRDEKGVLWIVKRHLRDAQVYGIERRQEKNFPRREMLAYLLTRTIANPVEVRFLSAEEAKGVSIFKDDLDNLRDYYLVRIGYGNNIPIDTLAAKDEKQACSANLVASILMRKWDEHRANVVFTGYIPVMIDNDECFRYDYFPHNKGFNKFAYLYLFHRVLLPIDLLLDIKITLDDSRHLEAIGNCTYLDDRSLLRSMYRIDLNTWREDRDDLWFGSALDVLISMLKDFGIGEKFFEYGNIDIKYIRAAIEKFKKIKNIRTMAKQAGYSDDDLASVVKFIQACQSTLGEDVNKILEIITGTDYGLDSLDKKFSSPKSSSAGKREPEWPEKVWDAVNELGIEKAKLMIYPHFAEYLSEKLGIDVMFLDTIRLADNGILHKLNQNVMSILGEGEYQKLLNDPEVGKYELEVCGIHGPGVCIMEDVFLFLSPPNKMAPHTYTFHEFCEYLAMEENDIDYTLDYFHGHCSFRVLVETFKFADKIGELRILLRDWKENLAETIYKYRYCYPAVLHKKFTTLLELAESGEIFNRSTDEVLAMLDEAAKEDETEKVTAQTIPAGSRDTPLVPVSKIQYDINSAISSCG